MLLNSFDDLRSLIKWYLLWAILYKVIISWMICTKYISRLCKPYTRTYRIEIAFFTSISLVMIEPLWFLLNNFSFIKEMHYPLLIFYYLTSLCRKMFKSSHITQRHTLNTKSSITRFKKLHSTPQRELKSSKIWNSWESRLCLAHHKWIKIVPDKMLQLRKLLHEKLNSCIKMRLIIMVDCCIYLNSDTEFSCILDRKHESFPWSWSICEKIMYLRIIRIHRKVYQLQSCISEFLHIRKARTHHTIWDDSRLDSGISCIRYPPVKIRGECRLTSSKNNSSVFSHDKIINNLYSFFIADVLSIWGIWTKVTSIVTMTIYLDVSDICHLIIKKINLRIFCGPFLTNHMLSELIYLYDTKKINFFHMN